MFSLKRIRSALTGGNQTATLKCHCQLHFLGTSTWKEKKTDFPNQITYIYTASLVSL